MKRLTVKNVNKLMDLSFKNGVAKTPKSAYMIAGECLTGWRRGGFKNAEDMFNKCYKKRG